MCNRKQPFECDARYNLILYEALMLLPSYQNGFQELPGQSIEANNFISPIKIRPEQSSFFKIFPNNQILIATHSVLEQN